MNEQNPESGVFHSPDSVTDEGLVVVPAACVGSAAIVIDVAQHGVDDGGRESVVAGQYPVPPGRSPLDDWRTALHEAGHVVVGRVLGEEVGGVTIVEGPDYGGLTWGPQGNSARLSNEKADLCEKIGALMPGDGEPRANAADIYAHCHVRVTDLCAGTAAETLLHPDDKPWIAHSDIRQARALASIICSSESAIDAYLLFGLAEAKALIMQHRAAVLAIAQALLIARTLNCEQIDAIIASAPEQARRVDWRNVLKSAADFAASEIGAKADMAHLGRHVAV
jgi:hypothetical protein